MLVYEYILVLFGLLISVALFAAYKAYWETKKVKVRVKTRTGDFRVYLLEYRSSNKEVADAVNEHIKNASSRKNNE